MRNEEPYFISFDLRNKNAINEKKKENENCTILIPKGNS